MNKNDAEKIIVDTLIKIKAAGFILDGGDIDTLIEIVEGNVTYTEIIDCLLSAEKTQENYEKLRMWLTLQKWQRDEFVFPSLAYSYRYEVIELVWPNGKTECVFHSLSEEKYLRDVLWPQKHEWF